MNKVVYFDSQCGFARTRLQNEILLTFAAFIGPQENMSKVQIRKDIVHAWNTTKGFSIVCDFTRDKGPEFATGLEVKLTRESDRHQLIALEMLKMQELLENMQRKLVPQVPAQHDYYDYTDIQADTVVQTENPNECPVVVGGTQKGVTLDCNPDSCYAQLYRNGTISLIYNVTSPRVDHCARYSCSVSHWQYIFVIDYIDVRNYFPLCMFSWPR